MRLLSDLLSEATLMLRNNGVDTPALDARLIAQHVLGISELTMLVNPDMCIGEEQIRKFSEAIARRLSGVPVAQIVGKREFWSMDFSVNSDVLDPRQDTETLVQSAIKLYRNTNRRITVADLGTGSGCIIIAILSHYKNAVGTAFERSTKAYRVAYRNLLKHGMLCRVKLRCMSWERCKGKFDLIVSNPPYIKRHKIWSLQREIRFQEPAQALDGGISGMEKYLQIFQVLRRCLTPSGYAILEIGEDQNKIRSEALKWGLEFCAYGVDLSGRKRCIILTLQG